MIITIFIFFIVIIVLIVFILIMMIGRRIPTLAKRFPSSPVSCHHCRAYPCLYQGGDDGNDGNDGDDDGGSGDLSFTKLIFGFCNLFLIMNTINHCNVENLV